MFHFTAKRHIFSIVIYEGWHSLHIFQLAELQYVTYEGYAFELSFIHNMSDYQMFAMKDNMK
jgi:hypothetical protein